MNRSERNELVEARADLTLACHHALKAYAAHFETELRHGKLRRLLYAGYVHSARACAVLTGFDNGQVS